MAQKKPANTLISLPYKDLASEVTRRRITMALRKEMITKKSEEAGEMPSNLGAEQEPSPNKTGPPVPPAPPPSPAEDSTDSQASTA